MDKNEYLITIENLKRSDNLIVYGLGEAGDNFERVCSTYGFHVKAYVDSYRTGKFYGHRIYCLEELKNMRTCSQLDVVICAGPAFANIKGQIIQFFWEKKLRYMMVENYLHTLILKILIQPHIGNIMKKIGV